jgi:hypothetical protein
MRSVDSAKYSRFYPSAALQFAAAINPAVTMDAHAA